jgi:hypothetical protein
LGIVACVDEKIDARAYKRRQHRVEEDFVVEFHALGFAALKEIDDFIGQQPDKVAGAER